MKALAIIPARGGSKRITRKNIKYFLGKPIIAYSIESALNSGLFDEVMVSTDDEEIAEIARSYGAEIPFLRSQNNSSDFSTTLDVIEEVTNEYKKQRQDFDFVCCLYPTAPFVSKNELVKGFHKLKKESFDSVFPVMKFNYPIQRALKVNSRDKVSLFQPEHLLTRSQDLEASYHDAGQYYWLKIDIVLRKKSLYTDNSGVVVIKEMEGQDIDTIEDWELAEIKYKLLHGKDSTI